MIKLLTGAAAAALISSTAALAVERSDAFRVYSDDPGVVLHAPYQSGAEARQAGEFYVGELDDATFGLVVGETSSTTGPVAQRMSQQYKIFSDDSGVVLQAPFQN